MSEELLINVTPNETRVALVENGVVQEVEVERQRSASLVGNIFFGKVSRVLPGMQAAFVEIGLERAGFLHASDIPLLDGEGMELPESSETSIHAKVHEGKSLMVQVVKAPIGTKGARLTTPLSEIVVSQPIGLGATNALNGLNGRFLLFGSNNMSDTL